MTANGNVYGRPNTSTPDQCHRLVDRRREPRGLQAPSRASAPQPARKPPVPRSSAHRPRRRPPRHRRRPPRPPRRPRRPPPRPRRRRRPRRPPRRPRPTTTTTKAPTTTTRPTPTAAVPEQYVSDVFARTTSNGLGTADIGGAYTVSSAKTGYFVANGVGRIPGAVGREPLRLPARRATSGTSTSSPTCRSTPSRAGAARTCRSSAAHGSAGTDYRLKVRYHARRLGRRRTSCASLNGDREDPRRGRPSPTCSVDPGDVVRARFVVERRRDDDAQGRGLEPRTAPDPSSWLMSTTDAAPEGAPGPRRRRRSALHVEVVGRARARRHDRQLRGPRALSRVGRRPTRSM